MPIHKVFYSWQSDLPNTTNRGFIEKALENAAKSIRADDSIKVEPVIDRDTAGVPGSPDIAKTIFDKIEQSHVFVCDVSIINKSSKFRKAPNPNVLLELGYAIKTLGEQRILMVMNSAFGPPELLPFDLNKKRVIPYCMPQQCQDRAPERKSLQSKLENALRAILIKLETQAQDDNPIRKLKTYLVDDRHRINLHDLMQNETQKIVEYIPTQMSHLKSDPLSTPDDILSNFEQQITTLRDLMITGCYYGEQKHDKLWQTSLEQVLNPPATDAFGDLKRYPALILLYAAGIPALLPRKYHTLKSLLLDAQYTDGGEKQPLILQFSAWDAIEQSRARELLRREKDITPVSNHLFELLRNPLSELLKDHSAYEDHFDKFEYFFALARADAAESAGYGVNVAIGRFVWKHMVRVRENRVYKSGIVDAIESEAARDGPDWAPIKAGFFKGDITRFTEIKTDFDKKLEDLWFQLRWP